MYGAAGWGSTPGQPKLKSYPKQPYQKGRPRPREHKEARDGKERSAQ